ncbi:MAG: hypothetical protein Q9211_006662, partial [Gyalolechia sp. 1 TL-2023]
MRAEEFAKTQNPDLRRLPSLIVCPPTLSGHWQQEIVTYAPFLSCLGFVGPASDRARLRDQLGKTDIVITSYEVCRNDIEVLATFNWNYCVLDEGHLIKNPRAKTTIAVKRLASNHRLILSGTPIQNNVLELWSLFDFLMPGFLGTEKVFLDRFAKPIAASRFSKSSSKEQEAGALAIEALHKQVLPFLLRRLKEEVLNDLPPKILQNYYCDLSDLQKRLFEDFAKRERKALTEAAGSEDKEAKQHIFQALQYMRKLCNSPSLVVKEGHKQYEAIQSLLAKQHSHLKDIAHAPKLTALRDLLVDCGIGTSASGNAGDIAAEPSFVSQHRALIFCQMKEMLDIVQNDVLRKLLPSVQYLRLDGSVEASKRQQIVNQFNTDPSYDCLLLTTSVGGLGLNLTGADTVIFVEHDWNPQKDLQAMDRAHRIGQKKVVNVYRLITRGTLEEKILNLQRFKIDVASTVVNQQNAGLSTMETGEILDLFNVGDTSASGPSDPTGKEEDMVDVTGELKEKGKKGYLDDLQELWDDRQYEEEARIILEAVHLASALEVPSLHQLIAREPEILPLELVLRIILTYLPESTEPTLYIELLHQLSRRAVHTPPASSIRPLPSGKELSNDEARHRVRQLHLLPLAEEQDLQAGCSDVLSLFLIHRSRRIDAETGSIPHIQELLEPFVGRDPYLRNWMISVVLPLRRLDYDYYDQPEDAYTLEAFEKLEGRPAIDSLLARSVRPSHEQTIQSAARDIRCVVAPCIYGESRRKRRKTHHDRRRSSLAGSSKVDPDAAHNEDSLSGWSHVNDWVVNLALRDFPSAAETIEHWGGPIDVDYGDYGDNEGLDDAISKTLLQRYARAGLATVYTNTDNSSSAIEKSHVILQKVARLADLQAPPSLDGPLGLATAHVSRDYLDNLSEVHLLRNALLRPDNPLTYPGQTALSFASLLLQSAAILQKLGHLKTCKATLGLSIFSRREDQMDELHKTLQKIPVKTRDEDSWAKVRHHILWLRDWRYQASEGSSEGKAGSLGVFGKIERVDLEVELLRALLRASCYNLAAYVYCMQVDRPIPDAILEKTILSVAMSFYDGASNGNRTRGGVRKASEMRTDTLTTYSIAAFQSHFQRSTSFNEANALLAATHSMSFYSLTLLHGVPFQPVNIRANKDPMSLIGKILEQNTRSYTKLDDLIEIGQNLTKAGLGPAKARDPNPPRKIDEASGLGYQLSESSLRITSMAIEAALSEDDFDTAYSYIVNRLSPTVPTSPMSPNNHDHNQANPKPETEDDISWRAAYLAGRSSSPSTSSSSLHRLSQRLELLSLALLLAPPPYLQEILGVWRAVETDLSTAQAREAAEEDRWNSKADRDVTSTATGVPGGFALFDPAAESDRIANEKRRREGAGAAKEEAPMGL